MRSLFLALTILIISPSLLAKETDNLTGRYKRLEDSTEILDKEMNKRLQELVAKANSKEIACSDPRNLRILFHELNPSTNMIGELETWAEDNDKIAKRKAIPANSIYNDVLAKGWLFNKLDLASTIKVNGQLIGTDKLGHFLDQGFTYYTHYRQAKYDLTPALTGSIGSEGSVMGGKSTGTKSYADSMANYHGIMFYHRLAEGDSPYLKCVNGEWSQSSSFTFADYVDESWDEGINCSQIVNPESNAIYEKNIQKLEADSKLRGREDNFRCPVEEACGKLRRRYATIEKYVLSPECRKAKMDAYSPAGGGSSGSSSKSKSVK